MQKLQLNILTSINCKDRVDNILGTWGSHCKFDIVFYSDYSDKDRNILCVSNNAGYYGVAEKTYNRIVQIFEEGITHDWYFFIDDDTCVNCEELDRFINESRDAGKVYGRACGSDDFRFIHGGAGILIGGDAFKKIDINTLTPDVLSKSSGFGDLYLGLVFRDNNIPLEFHDSQFCGWEHEFNTENNIVSVHPIRTFDRMKYYCDLFK